MKKTIAFALAGVTFAVAANAAVDTRPMLYEEGLAHQEEGLILRHPIAGVRNHFWFDYRINNEEARKELASDLGRASDTEDRRDAWDEYAHELHHNRAHYVKVMAKRGYPTPVITLEDRN